VRSALFGVAPVTVAPGSPMNMQVVVVSNASDLCSKLNAHPDYFHQNTEPSVSFVMWVQADRIGDFLLPANNSGSEIVLGRAAVGSTTPVPTLTFAPVAGDINVGQQDSQLQGGFDIAYFVNGAAPEYVGRFKANPCTFPAGILVP
jgi:hypothetical protein